MVALNQSLRELIINPGTCGVKYEFLDPSGNQITDKSVIM